jgi:hypothetical protein
MGILSTVMRSNAAVHHGGHSLKTSEVLKSVPDAVTAKSPIQWQVSSSPTVIRQPQTATVAQADRAEREAARYSHAVTQGMRVMAAEEKRQTAHAKLVSRHRRYLGVTAESHHKISAANRGLAGKLHHLREQAAQLGYSLDRAEERADQNIELIAHKYGAVK